MAHVLGNGLEEGIEEEGRRGQGGDDKVRNEAGKHGENCLVLTLVQHLVFPGKALGYSSYSFFMDVEIGSLYCTLLMFVSS